MTRGGLEVVAGPAGPLRVALLPSGWQALSLIAAAMAGAALGPRARGRLGGRRRRAAPSPTPTPTSTRPLFATGVLVLPFLPWLADAWPALTVLAGRFALLVWFVGGGARRCGPRGSGSARRAASHHGVPPPAPSLIVAGRRRCSTAASPGASPARGLFPGGDEPHYLVIAQSLWRDGDFKIENNHARGDTLEYYRLPLTPHYLERGRDGEIYSIHPVGLAIVAAPIYAAGGYYGVVAFLVCCAAGAGDRAVGGGAPAHRIGAAAATLAWIGAAASAPFVFNSVTVYPEIPAAACAMAAYLLATRPGGLGQRPRLAARAALCLARAARG